jgi:hypothetical protein
MRRRALEARVGEPATIKPGQSDCTGEIDMLRVALVEHGSKVNTLQIKSSTLYPSTSWPITTPT